jgi:hypothetical protein
MRRYWHIQPASALIALALTVLIAVNGYNFAASLADAPYAYTLGLSYPPLLRIASALLWAALFAVLLIGVVRGRPGVRGRVAPALTVYGAWSVIWLIVFARSDYAHGRIAFQAAATVVLLLPFWWLHRRSI